MDIGLLLLRLAVGLTIAAHGTQKLFGWFGGDGLDGTGQFMEGLGFHPGRRHALMAGLVEASGGILLTLGFLTPLGAALVVSVMLVAALTVHIRNGFFATNGGYEYVLMVGVGALSLSFTGPGKLSVDALLGYSLTGLVWGIGSAAVAVLGALAQLTQRRLPPVTDNDASPIRDSVHAVPNG
jgi:putative oxidoreductase